jgi:hypothetical protein
MVFQSKKPSEESEKLPGGGLELDLDRRMCSSCGREAPPWEERCRECGGATVPPEQAPAPQFRLPHLEDDEDDEAPGGRDADDEDGEPTGQDQGVGEDRG